ncbi:MAG: DUF3696 domain-containing protein [Magnetococcus sp. YQC-5]
MFTKFRLVNFKSWQDTQEQPLAPLTVFFGPNSAGKSSLSHFFLALKQTVDSTDRSRVLHFGNDMTAIDLGSFQDIINNHDDNKKLTFFVEWKLAETEYIVDVVSGQEFTGNRMRYHADIRFNEGTLKTEQLKYTLMADGANILDIAMQPGNPQSLGYQLKSRTFMPELNPGRKWPVPPPVKCYGFPNEALAYYKNTGFLSRFSLAFERVFERLFYLGPLRDTPKRIYKWSGEQPEHVGWRGERSVEAILASQHRAISSGAYQRYHPFMQVIARWLKNMGLITSFNMKPIAEHRKEYEVKVCIRDGIEVNLTDVGFGLSQVIPVIVQCFHAPAHSVILLEQPEIHLHPQVQATLADLFIEAIHAKENSKERNIQLIVESHSEHFLRRLQRRIAEEKVTPGEVAIYFCEQNGQSSTLTPLEVDEYGNISNWPDNFFGDETGDLIAMTEAAMQRQTR